MAYHRITIPTFPRDAFAAAVAGAVSADAEGQSVTIRFADGATGQPVGSLAAADIGQQPITFVVTGRANIIWNVDSEAFAEALAGREESAFESIVKGFPSVEEARARIMPFWKHSFPTDPTKIEIRIEDTPAVK